MPMLRVPLAALLLATIWVPEAMSETTFSGQTVEFRTEKGIDGVTVKVKDARDNKVLGSARTDSSGRYRILISEEPSFVSVTYDPPAGSSMDPAARANLTRVGPRFELDTAGLTNKNSGKSDEAEQRQHASNTRAYASAGGDANAAAASMKAAVSRFGQAYLGVAQQMGIKTAFERAGIPFP